MHCLDDFESDHCPVCHDKIGKLHIDERVRLSLHEHYKDQIWKPGDPIPEETHEISERRRAVMEALENIGR